MQITENIHALKIPFSIPVAPDKRIPRMVHVYLIAGQQTALVDSGVAGAEAIIFDYFETIGKGMGIDLLLFTHAHPDHIGAAKAIRGKCNCRTASHANARRWIENIDQQFEERPVPGFHSLIGGSVPLDSLLCDQDRIDLGNISLLVLHTPGHSKDSVTFFCPEEGVMICGDAIPQPGDLPIYEDPSASVQSIRKMKNTSGVKHLLSSWCAPEPDANPHSRMDRGLAQLQKIHSLIRSLPDEEKHGDPMQLCAAMVRLLQLPEIAVNPLVARSFASHLPYLNREVL
jgi:hydroxyacylglutathione hydrolase